MSRMHSGHDNPHEGMPAGDRLLRLREVIEMTGLSSSTIYRLKPKGEFPLAIKVGPRAVRWRLSEIIRWMESRPNAGGSLGSPNAA